MSRKLKKELSFFFFFCAHTSMNVLVSLTVVAQYSIMLHLQKLQKVCTFLQNLGEALRASADNCLCVYV